MQLAPRLLFLLAFASGAVLLCEHQALAQPYYEPAYGPPPPAYGPPPGYYRPRRMAPSYYDYAPHSGFFTRLDAGFGYLSASEAGVTFSGVGATFGGAFGGAIAPDLIIFGEILGTSITDADVSGSSGVGSSGLDLTLVGFGPGMAYYIEPINVYLSGTLAFSKVYVSYTGTGFSAGDTDLGIGASFMIGKEWWVRRRLGIGLAGQVHVASVRDPTADARMTATAASLLFSATFN